MKLVYSRIVFFASCLLFLAFGCTAPRSVIHSGKVTPKGQFKAGGNWNGNLATAPIIALGSATKNLIENLKDEDSVFVSAGYDPVTDISKAVLAYTLDPASSNFDIYLRYGLAKRVDVGYKYAFGTHVFDGMYQFMGSTGTIANPGAPGTYGSVGIQISRQNTELPFSSLLDAVDLLNYSASRTDILIPVVFSQSFGPEETVGNFSYGVAYSRSFVSYTFNPSNFFIEQGSRQDVIPIEKLSGKNNYGSFGIFANLKLGYKYAYVLPAFAMYYQNYGTYKLPGGKETELKGITFIPSIGLQFQFGKGLEKSKSPAGR